MAVKLADQVRAARRPLRRLQPDPARPAPDRPLRRDPRQFQPEGRGRLRVPAARAHRRQDEKDLRLHE